MEEHQLVKALLPGLRFVLERTNANGTVSQHTVAPAYVSSPWLDECDETQRLILESGNHSYSVGCYVGFNLLYEEDGIEYGTIWNGHLDDVTKTMLSLGIAVLRNDARSKNRYWEVASSLNFYQALGQVGRRGFWKAGIPLPESCKTVGSEKMTISGRIIWTPDTEICSESMRIQKVVSADTYLVPLGGRESVELHLPSIRICRELSHLADQFAQSCFSLVTAKVNLESIVRGSNENERDCNIASVVAKGRNIASTLVENGMAVVSCFTDGLMPLSLQDEMLLQLQATATKRKRGVHKLNTIPNGLTDASTSLSSAKKMLPILKTAARLDVTVEVVTSGGFMWLTIPHLNTILNLSLGGVWVPRPDEPFGVEALEFTRKFLAVNKIQLSVTNISKNGRFIGHIFALGQDTPLSVILVRQGLAEVRESTENDSKILAHLESSRIEAVNAGIGLWEDQKHQTGGDESPESAPAGPVGDYIGMCGRRYVDVAVTAIDWRRNRGKFAFCRPGRLKEKEQLDIKLAAVFHNSLDDKLDPEDAPRAGDVMIVNVGCSYLRCKIERAETFGGWQDDVFEMERYDVLLVDRRESASGIFLDDMRFLPKSLSLDAIPPFAEEFGMSFLGLPFEHYFGPDCVETIRKCPSLVARIDVPGEVPLVTLFKDDSDRCDDSISWLLVQCGHATVRECSRKFAQWQHPFDLLFQAKEAAKKASAGCWRLGEGQHSWLYVD